MALLRCVQATALSSSRKHVLSARSSSTRRYSCPVVEGPTENYDIVIVGGGPVGLAFAAALNSVQATRQALKVALIESGDLNKVGDWQAANPNSYSNRVSSITNASRLFLQDIDAWQHVDETRTCPVEEMLVWDGVSGSSITFSASEILSSLGDEAPMCQTAEMARMTENLNLQRALLRHIRNHDRTCMMDNTKVESIQSKEGWPVVRTSDGRAIRARLLVGADGFNSPVRKYAGIDSYGWMYDTHAIVATLDHHPRIPSLQAPNTTAYQRFLPSGPIAFLPLTQTTSSLVWSTKPGIAKALKSVDPAIFALMVNAAFRLPEVSLRHLYSFLLERTPTDGCAPSLSLEEVIKEVAWRERSHAIDAHSAYSSLIRSAAEGIPPEDAESVPPLVASVQAGTIASFPLRMNHADSYIGEGKQGCRTALLGDAAHSVHPLAGQGLNLGLADAQSLAQCIHNAVAAGSDVGSRTSLLPYARERYFENHKILSATDKLHKIYSSTAEPVVWARSVGLEVVQELDTLKAALMASAGARARITTHSNALSPFGFVAQGAKYLSGAAEYIQSLGNEAGKAASSTLDKANASLHGLRR